jgi:sulfoxide reductase catalytic subunit YedY
MTRKAKEPIMFYRRSTVTPRAGVTNKALYRNRREFIRSAAAAAAAATASVAAGDELLALGVPAAHGPQLPGVQKSPLSASEPPNSWDEITSYNNFYEFAGSDDKDLPSILAPLNLITKPWSITVDGECARKGTYPLEAILEGQVLEERIYRLRCVEGWSMVVPWVGFPLSTFISRCEPTAKARFVRFESHYDVRRMPRSLRLAFGWPFKEGLRLDEAMHPLTILAVGLYGEALPHQDGAPIRLVVPWKYGFKSIKSIVRIEFVAEQPVGTYQQVDPESYGFYSNVNPAVPHPRWSQETERRIGEFLRRKTVLFNGYGDQVAKLYAGMDLSEEF